MVYKTSLFIGSLFAINIYVIIFCITIFEWLLCNEYYLYWYFMYGSLILSHIITLLCYLTTLILYLLNISHIYIIYFVGTCNLTSFEAISMEYIDIFVAV